MTSMPASRRARAMTLAPRSWPSRPGFAITTRIFCISNERNFLVLSPHVAKRIAHFADGGVGADAVQQRIHRIARAARGLLQQVQAAPDLVVVARPAQRFEPR